MENKKIIIGIPAFNEEDNIKRLLDNILKANLEGVELIKIIVVSDGSTDETNNILEEFKLNPKLEIIINEKRSGKPYILNLLTKKIQYSETLILLDADILIPNIEQTLLILTNSITESSQYASVKAEPLKPKGFFERIIYQGFKIQGDIFSKLNNGKNIYLSSGRACALGNKLCKEILWPERAGTDMYTYAFAKKNMYDFILIPSNPIYYRIPTNLQDHLRQSLRFQGALKGLRREFGKNVVISINPFTTLKGVTKNLIESPLYTPLYLFILFLTIFFKKTYPLNGLWDIALSTKKI